MYRFHGYFTLVTTPLDEDEVEKSIKRLIKRVNKQVLEQEIKDCWTITGERVKPVPLEEDGSPLDYIPHLVIIAREWEKIINKDDGEYFPPFDPNHVIATTKRYEDLVYIFTLGTDRYIAVNTVDEEGRCDRNVFELD